MTSKGTKMGSKQGIIRRLTEGLRAGRIDVDPNDGVIENVTFTPHDVHGLVGTEPSSSKRYLIAPGVTTIPAMRPGFSNICKVRLSGRKCPKTKLPFVLVKEMRYVPVSEPEVPNTVPEHRHGLVIISC